MNHPLQVRVKFFWWCFKSVGTNKTHKICFEYFAVTVTCVFWLLASMSSTETNTKIDVKIILNGLANFVVLAQNRSMCLQIRKIQSKIFRYVEDRTLPSSLAIIPAFARSISILCLSQDQLPPPATIIKKTNNCAKNTISGYNSWKENF